MNVPMHLTKHKLIFALGALLSLSFLSCENRYNNSTLIITQIRDNDLNNPLIYVSLSRSPDYVGGFKIHSAVFDIASATTPAVVFDSISWDNTDRGKEFGEFWLLIAQDTAAPPGVIGDGDLVMPAMRVILVDGQTTTIPIVFFDTGIVPSPKLLTLDTSASQKTIRLYIEQPQLISASSPMYLRLGAGPSLAAGGAYDIPIPSGSLASGLSLRTGELFALVWIDNGLLGLNSGDGDLVSINPTTPHDLNPPPPASTNYFNWVLWSGQTY
jgi:hypothetical protein